MTRADGTEAPPAPELGAALPAGRRRPRGIRRLVGNRLLYILPTAANGLVTLLTIPTVIRTAGPSAWTAIALGQAIGGVGMTIVAFGWAVSGPADVGNLPPGDRGAYFTKVVAARAILAVPVFAGCYLVCALVPGIDAPLAGVASIAAAGVGMNAVWFFVGTGQPLKLLLYDTAPRVGSMLLGIVLILTGAPTILLPVVQALGVFAGVLVSWLSVSGSDIPRDLRRLTIAEIGRSIAGQTSGVGFGLLGAFVMYLPLPVVAVVAPDAANAFAVIDKVQKQLSTAAVPFGNMVVASMAQRLRDPDRTGPLAVARRSSLEALVVAACCGGIALLVATALGTWLSAGSVEITPFVAALVAAVVALTFVGRTLPPAVLAPLGRVRVALYSGIAGAVVVGPSVILGARANGFLGAELGLVAACAVIAALQLVVPMRARRVGATPEQAAR